VREAGTPAGERAAMAAMARVFASRRAYEAAQRAARLGRGPLAGAALRPWTRSRELPEVPSQSFREWWRSRPEQRRAQSRQEDGPRGPDERA
jgi:L-lactate dehydrogenase complex protein LldF